MHWLIEETAMAAVQRAWQTEPTAAQLQAMGARAEPSPMTVSDGVAQIDVIGVLTEQPDPWLRSFGVANTSYASIRGALEEAARDASVTRVLLWANSPGGQVDGLFETLAAIQESDKPMSVTAARATSAAYAIAAAAGPIRALGASSTFGSVGVAASYRVDASVVDIASTEAPNKRPDVSTAEGRAVVRGHLDDLHALFVEAIAEGRGTTPERVNAEFGRGGLVLAAEAQRRGMIDGMGPAQDRRETRAAPVATSKKVRNMDADEFKTKHPEAYAAAVAEGVAQERDRVGAHLIRGRATGRAGLEVALTAIEGGETMTQVLEARYFAAGINERDLAARVSDDAAAAHALDGAAAPPTPDGAAAVADALEGLMGGGN